MIALAPRTVARLHWDHFDYDVGDATNSGPTLFTMLFYLAKRLSVLSTLLFIITSPTAAAPNDNPSTVKITYQNLNSPSTQPLATITYDPSTLRSTLVSWTPPLLDSLKVSTTEPVSSPLIRILLPSGSSTLTSLANFNTTLN